MFVCFLVTAVLAVITFHELRLCIGLGSAESLVAGEILSSQGTAETVQLVRYRYSVNGATYENYARITSYAKDLEPGDHVSVSFLPVEPGFSAIQGQTPMRKLTILACMTVWALGFSLVLWGKRSKET